LPLVIVVAVVLIAGLIWRALSTRRLTVEESVDRYRRTLGAVHDAAARAHPSSGGHRAPVREPTRPGSNRAATLASRRSLVVVAMAVATIVVVSVVIATHHGKSKARTSATTTSRPAPRPATTTTRPAPTTTTPLVKPSGAANSFTVAKASYTIVVQTTGSQCWVDMRDPSGTALFSGTLGAVAEQSITASDVTIRLGNPAAVTISVDGTRVPFTVPSGSPATLHFQGSAAVS
jgi:cytoskeletal protein RodZ